VDPRRNYCPAVMQKRVRESVAYAVVLESMVLRDCVRFRAPQN
jgi:hypothetical protein